MPQRANHTMYSHLIWDKDFSISSPSWQRLLPAHPPSRFLEYSVLYSNGGIMVLLQGLGSEHPRWMMSMMTTCDHLGTR